MADPVLLLVSIDTEEDNWYRSRDRVTCGNITALRRQARWLESLGVRATYFTSYQVAINPRAADVVREVGSEAGEIAAHLHPWNTPPLDEAFTPRHSMLKNLPAALQRAKLQTLTDTMERVFGTRPLAFRAGRYGLGADTIAPLMACGYHVDSSVTPFVSWEEFDDGPTFVGAPLDIYRVSPGREVTDPAQGDGAGLVEVPLSCGFSRAPFAMWGRVRGVLETPSLRRFRLVGLASRTGLCKRLVLSPELATTDEMITLSRRLLESGVRHLHMTWHSPTLVPGLSPFAASAADVERLYATVERYLDRLSGLVPLTFATVSEAAAAVETAPC